MASATAGHIKALKPVRCSVPGASGPEGACGCTPLAPGASRKKRHNNKGAQMRVNKPASSTASMVSDALGTNTGSTIMTAASAKPTITRISAKRRNDSRLRNPAFMGPLKLVRLRQGPILRGIWAKHKPSFLPDWERLALSQAVKTGTHDDVDNGVVAVLLGGFQKLQHRVAGPGKQGVQHHHGL